jgi:ATP-binding cassette, subfamily B, multidrug efflux pump
MRIFHQDGRGLTTLNGFLIVSVTVGWAIWLWQGSATAGTVAAAAALVCG